MEIIKEKKITKRQKRILDLWNSGEHTLQSIGDIFGISRERIRQILSRLKSRGFMILSSKETSILRREKHLSNQRKYIDINQFMNMYHSGCSKTEIRRKLSIKSREYDMHKNYLLNKGVISNRKRILDTIKFDLENGDEIKRHRESIIMKMRHDNCNLVEIANKLQISKVRLTQIIKDMKDKGYLIPNSQESGNPLSDDEITSRINNIEHCLDKGMNIRQISHVMNLQESVIKRLIYRYLVINKNENI